MRLRRSGGGDPAAREVRERAEAGGERVTASVLAPGGEAVVATTHALHVDGTRLPWDRVAKATWDDDAAALTVVGSQSPDEPARRLTVVLGDGDGERLAAAVRVAVTSNILVAQRIDSVEHGGAWVTARRVPGRDEVRWTVVFDPGRDPRDASRRAWADRHVAVLRDATGV